MILMRMSNISPEISNWLISLRESRLGSLRLNFSSKIQFFMILKISDFCQKFSFGVFWGVTGHSGILGVLVLLFFSRFQNWFRFASPASAAWGSIFDPKFNFWRFWKFQIFVKNLVFDHFGRALDTRGLWRCQFFWFLVDLKILIFLVFWSVWKSADLSRASSVLEYWEGSRVTSQPLNFPT